LIQIAIADERRAKTQEEYDQLAEVSAAITEQLELMQAENLAVMEGVTREQLQQALEEVNNRLAVVSARRDAENEQEAMAQAEEAIAERKKAMQQKQEEW